MKFSVMSRRRGRVLSAVGLVAVAAAVLSSCSSGGSDGAAASGPKLTKSEIVIGQVGTFSGLVSNLKHMPSVLTAWAEWKNNNGGINGHPVRVVSIDDKADAAASTAAVKQLVENDHVVAIVAAGVSGLEGGWADYVKSKGVPVIGGTASTTQAWTSNPIFFPASATLRTAVFSTASAAKARGKTTFGVINCVEHSACAQAIPLSEEGAKAAGLKVGYTATVAATAANYTANCIAAKDSGTDAISLGLSGDTVIRLVADCKRQGYTPQWVLPSTVATPAVIASPNLSGTLITLDTFPWFLNNDQTKDFHAVAKIAGIKDSDLAPADPIPFVSAQVFAKALASAPDTVTSQDVLNGLYTIKNETLGGLTGPLTFSATDAPGARAVNCYFTAQAKDGKLEAPDGMKQSCVNG